MSEISEITKVALRQDQGTSIIKSIDLEMEDSGKIFSFDLNEEIKVPNLLLYKNFIGIWQIAASC